jgi:hypothetical protein
VNASAVRSFAAVELAGWPGLSAPLSLAEARSLLSLDDDATGAGVLGSERRRANWAAAESTAYEGGLLVWHASGEVLVLEGRDPVDGAGEPLVAPDLGEPEALLDASLGRLLLPGGERVYGSRGLALRVNPDNGLLLGVLGFAPVAPGEYEARLRPELPPRRLLPIPPAHGSAW